MSDNTSTLTIELNTSNAETSATNLANSISAIGSKLEETLKKFTEFQTKLNAINAKVNINVSKINDITGVQQAVDSYLATNKLKTIDIKVNAKLVVDKITSINQESIEKAVKTYNASAPISRQKVSILADATIEVAKIIGEVKGIPAAMRAFNASAPIAGKTKITILADASVEVAKILGEPKGIREAMKAYNASAPIAGKSKINILADASITVMKIVGAVQGLPAAMRDFNRSVPITTSVIKVWADAKLFIMNVTGIDGRSIRDALAARTSPIEITTPITVVAKRIRVIADPTANVTVIVGQLQAAGANTQNATKSTNDWYRKLLDVYLISRAIESVSTHIKEIWEAGVEFAKVETALTAITGSLSGANKEITWLLDTADKIGLSFQSAAVPFAKFAAAAKGMFSTSEIKQMYVDLGKVAVAMHLNKEETNGVFLAIQQMSSKGVVSMEELRLQFAERIPGAMAIAAASVNMTMAEFTKKVSAGEMGSEFLKNFLSDTAKYFATAADLAAESFIGVQHRLENALFRAKAAVLQSGVMEQLSQIAVTFTDLINSNTGELQKFGEYLSNTVGKFKDMLTNSENINKSLELLKAFMAGALGGVNLLLDALDSWQAAWAIDKITMGLYSIGLVLAEVGVAVIKVKGFFTGDTFGLDEQTAKVAELREKLIQLNSVPSSKKSLVVAGTILQSSPIGEPAEVAPMSEAIKKVYTDVRILNDSYDITRKATKAAFGSDIQSDLKSIEDSAARLAILSPMDKLITSVEASTKEIEKLKTSLESLNFDVTGKTVSEVLSERILAANSSIKAGSEEFKTELTNMQNNLKLSNDDMTKTISSGSFVEFLDKSLQKTNADMNEFSKKAQELRNKEQEALSSLKADLDKKTQVLIAANTGNSMKLPEKAFDEKKQASELYQTAKAKYDNQINFFESLASGAVASQSQIKGMLDELNKSKDAISGKLQDQEIKRAEAQAKINEKLEEELKKRQGILDKTNDILQKEEQRKKLLAIASGEVGADTLESIIQKRLEGQRAFDALAVEQQNLINSSAKLESERLATQTETTKQVQSQVEATKELAKVTSVSTGEVTKKAADFMGKYGEVFSKAAAQLGVSPTVIAAQAALETRYGASVIPGTNNLFNVKEFAKGKGVTAVDNALKTASNYKQFGTPEEAVNNYVDLIKRKYPEALGAKTAGEFAAALKKGGYAEDAEYVNKLVNVAKNFGDVTVSNTTAVKSASLASNDLNQAIDDSRNKMEANNIALQNQAQLNANLSEQIIKVSEARIADVLAQDQAARDLEKGKVAKFEAADYLKTTGKAGISDIQNKIDEAKKLSESINSQIASEKLSQSKIAASIPGGILTGAEGAAKQLDLENSNRKLAALKDAGKDATDEMHKLGQAVTEFNKAVASELTTLQTDTQGMLDEMKYGADYAARIRIGQRGGAQALEIFDKNKTTKDLYEFTKAAGTSFDGLKDTFASVFVAMGDTTKTFTESMADMFDNMVTRMLDASSKLMANGLLDWFNNVQGGGTNFLLGAIGTAVSLGVKLLTKTPSRSAPSTAQTGESSALGIASMRAADVFGRDTALQFDTVAAAQYNASLKSLASIAYDKSKDIVEFLSNVGDNLGVSGAASYVKDLFSPITDAFTKGSALIDSATSSFSSSFSGLSDKYIAPAFDYFGSLIGASSTTAGFAGLQGGSIASSWSAGISQLPSNSWTAGTNGIYSFGQNGGTFAGSVQASEAAAPAASGSAGFLGPAAATIATFKAGYDIVNVALDETASFGEQAAKSLYGVRDAALSWALVNPALAPILLPVAAIANITGSVSDMIDGDFKRGLRNLIFGPFGDIIAELTGFLKTRTPNAWINQFNPLGAGYTPEKMAPITAQAPGYKALDNGLYQRGTNKGLFIGTETRLGSVELSYHEIHRKTDMTELDNQFKELLKMYRQTNNNIANSLDAIDAINKQSVSTVGLFLGKLGDGEEKNRIALKQELSDLDTGNMTDKLYGDISVRLRETGTKAGMIWSTIFDNLMVAFKNISGDNSVFAAGAANLASVLAIPLNQFSVQVVDDLTKAIKAPAVGGSIADVEKELETNVSSFKKMFAVINDPQFGIGAGVSDTKISGLIMSWSKLGLGIEETSNSWIAFVDLFHKAQPTLDVTKFESEMTKAWDGLIKKFVDTGLTQVQAVSLTSSAVVGASVLKEKGVADKDLLQGGLAFAEAARKAATKNLDAAEAAIQDAIAKGKAEGVLKASMSREQMTAILIRTKAIDQQTAIEADFSVQQAKATQTLLEGYGAVFSVVKGLGLNLEDFGLTVSDIPTVVNNLTNSFGDMSKAIEYVRENIRIAFGSATLTKMDVTNAYDKQRAAIEKSPILKAAGFTAGMTEGDVQNLISSLSSKDQTTAKTLVSAATPGTAIGEFLTGTKEYTSAQQAATEATNKANNGLLYIDNQLVKSTDSVTQAFGSLREGIDTVGDSLSQFASETNKPILSKALAEFQLSSIISKPELSGFFKDLNITPQNASSRLSEIVNQYAAEPKKLTADAGALAPILAAKPELKTAWDNFMTYAAQQMNAINDANKPYEEANKQAADNAKTLADKQKDINDQVKDFAASDANKKIMAVNKEITNLADEAAKLGGALTDLETLRMLKLGQVYKEQYDSIEPLLEISNKLGMTNIDLTTAMTKDQNGLWHFSQSMIDLIPTLKDVVDNIGAYKTSLEALDKAQKIIGNSGMSDQAVKVSEIIASALTDLTALSKTPLISGADSIVNAANIQAGEVFKPIVDELNNIGKSDATKSIEAVSKELAGWREALRLWANSSDYAKKHFEEFSGILDQIEASRLNEIANKLKDIMDGIYTTFNRAQSTRAISANTPIASSFEDKLWGIRDNYINLINSIIQNSGDLGTTLSKVTDVFNIIQTTSSQALDDAKKEVTDKFKSIFTSIADAAQAQDIFKIKMAAGFDTKKADEEVYAYQKAALIKKAIAAQQAQDYQGQMDAVNEAHNLIMSHYETQKQAIQDLDTFAKGLKDHVKQLLVDNSLSILTNQQRLNEAAQQYSDIFAAATSTSDTQARTDARGKLTGSADTYLQQARSFYASGAEYTKIFNQVTGQLSGVADVKSPQEQLVDINTSMNTELGVISSYLEEIKNQQILAKSNELTQLQASFAKVASDFTNTLTQLAIDKGAPIQTALKIAVVGDLTDKEVDLITALYTKNPEQVFTATLKGVRDGDLTNVQGVRLFDGYFSAAPEKTFALTLAAYKDKSLSTTESLILFERMFSSNPEKTFSLSIGYVRTGELSTVEGMVMFDRIFATFPEKTFTVSLKSVRVGELSTVEGLILFDRMFSTDPARTFSSTLISYTGGLLSQTEGLILFNRMFATNPATTFSSTLTAYTSGLLSSQEGLGLWQQMFAANPDAVKSATITAIASGLLSTDDGKALFQSVGLPTIVSKTANVSAKITGDEDATKIALGAYTNPTSTVTIKSALAWDIATVNQTFQSIIDNTKRTADLLFEWLPAINDGTHFTKDNTGFVREYTKWTANNIVAQTEALVRRSYGLDGNPSQAYQTFAKGGVTNQASIFGEAGWEAAVPLPDGRTIPVTVQSAPQQQDNSDVVEAIIRSMRANAEGQKELKAELTEAKAELARLRKQLVQS